MMETNPVQIRSGSNCVVLSCATCNHAQSHATPLPATDLIYQVDLFRKLHATCEQLYRLRREQEAMETAVG